jgi:SpoVK/Ycf46/Vps4 family AAA+-type ATPase
MKKQIPSQYTSFVSYLDSYKENAHVKKGDIQQLVHKINEDFYMNKYYSKKYVGDVYLNKYPTHGTKKDAEDDYYSLYGHNHYYQSQSNTFPKKNSSSFPKTKVNIEVNVQSVADLLKIIQTYEYKESEEYNIDLKSLINIKTELTELDNMIGMNNLKSSILNQLLYFVQELHIEKSKNVSEFKHTVICGPPGTGKTEVAKIIGRMYSKLGILKNSVFKKVTRHDLVAGYLGQTAIKTKKVIQQALGGVLFIDEAYSLGGENSDNYSKECLDTLCHELSEYKDELMVIIAGYENELNKYFFSKNKGLDSRFVWRFEIDSYSYKELMYIFIKKINDIGWKVDEDNKINEEWFKTKMSYFTNYGRDMEILLLKTKIVHSKRVFGKPDLLKKITLEDLNNGFELYKDNSEVKKEIPSFYC